MQQILSIPSDVCALVIQFSIITGHVSIKSESILPDPGLEVIDTVLLNSQRSTLIFYQERERKAEKNESSPRNLQQQKSQIGKPVTQQVKLEIMQSVSDAEATVVGTTRYQFQDSNTNSSIPHWKITLHIKTLARELGNMY